MNNSTSKIPWRCPSCGYASTRRGNVKRHIMSQHGGMGEPAKARGMTSEAAIGISAEVPIPSQVPRGTKKPDSIPNIFTFIDMNRVMRRIAGLVEDRLVYTLIENFFPPRADPSGVNANYSQAQQVVPPADFWKDPDNIFGIHLVACPNCKTPVILKEGYRYLGNQSPIFSNGHVCDPLMAQFREAIEKGIPVPNERLAEYHRKLRVFSLQKWGEGKGLALVAYRIKPSMDGKVVIQHPLDSERIKEFSRAHISWKSIDLSSEKFLPSHSWAARFMREETSIALGATELGDFLELSQGSSFVFCKVRFDHHHKHFLFVVTPNRGLAKELNAKEYWDFNKLVLEKAQPVNSPLNSEVPSDVDHLPLPA